MAGVSEDLLKAWRGVCCGVLAAAGLGPAAMELPTSPVMPCC